MKTFLLSITLIFSIFAIGQKDVPNKKIKTKQVGTIQYQGKTYKTVKIDDQIWMAQNLKARKFRNGDPIAQVNHPAIYTNTLNCSAWSAEWLFSNKNLRPVWCFPDDNSSLGKEYGLLYNQHVIQDKREVCPTGWSVPSRNDWLDLLKYLEIEDFTDDDDGIKLYKPVKHLDLTYGDSIKDVPFVAKSGFDAVFSGVITTPDGNCAGWKRSGPGAYSFSNCDIFESGWWTSYSTQTDASGNRDIHYIYIRLIDAPSGLFKIQVFPDFNALQNAYGTGFPIRCIKNK